MSGREVEFDTTDLERGARSLVRGVESRTGPVASRTAQEVASRIRSGVPVRTGRLRATVSVSTERAGSSVHYGGGLPYANYIERRAHAVEDGISGADEQFERAMTALAALEVSRL